MRDRRSAQGSCSYIPLNSPRLDGGMTPEGGMGTGRALSPSNLLRTSDQRRPPEIATAQTGRQAVRLTHSA